MIEPAPTILLANKQLERLTQEYLWGPQETIVFASEIVRISQNGKTCPKILIISYGAIYLFRSKTTNKNELAGIFYLIDVDKISYIKPNIVTFNIGNSASNDNTAITLQSDKALDIARLILYFNKICKFKVSEAELPKIDSTPPGALVSPIIPARPKNSLQIRILQLAHKYNQKFPIDQLKYIADWDRNPQTILRLTQAFKCGIAAPSVATAISWDMNLKCLILDAFEPQYLPNVLQIIISKSKTLVKLSLENYKSETTEMYDLPAPITSKFVDITFNNCHPSLIFSVLNGMNSFAGHLKTLTITKVKLSEDDFNRLFELLGSLSCFMSITKLCLDEGTADDMNISSLTKYLPNNKIFMLNLSKTNKDISILLKGILSHTTTIHMLYLSGCNLFKNMNKKNFVLTSCLSYLDLSKSIISPVALRSFLVALFSQTRDHLLTLNLSDLIISMPDESSNESIVKCFDIPDPQSVLAEFIFSDNILLPENVKELLQFLKSQKQLYYLKLSRCFKEQFDASLKAVSDFIIETQLQGIDISTSTSDPYNQSATFFINSLVGKSSLKTLMIENSGMGDKGLNALKAFVEEDNKLTSLNCDGAKPDTAAAFNKAYLAFTKIERIAPPKQDLALLNGQGFIPTGLAAKLPPKTLAMRINEYESLEGTNSQVIQPMDALITMMNMMTQSITGNGPDIIEKQDLISVFHESLITTSIVLKPQNTNGANMLFNLLTPSTNKNGITAMDTLTENSNTTNF